MKDEFTVAQNEAITHKMGPALILAGPGSGKTLVITQRTKYLIEECAVSPGNVLVITFTRAAALEMKERFLKLSGGIKGVSFGTFHAIYFKILRYAYNYNSENIIPEDVKYQYIKEIIGNLNLEIDDEDEFCAGIINEISSVKGDMIQLEHYYSKNCPDDVFNKIYSAYDEKLKASNKIDFDDMLLLCYQLLKQRQDILSIWQKKYKYILVDEFQDINRIQYEIIKMLALPENNLFIVGDDDQSIYRFRGARPEIMLNFSKDYPECRQILLDKNFRSGKRIVDASKKLIKNNTRRFKKDINAYNDFNGDIEYIEFDTPHSENKHIVDEIIKYRNDNIPYGNIAILFRTNRQPVFLVDKLMEYNIPFYMKDSINNIYEHWIAKNIYAYINLALGGRQRSDLYQIMNRPKRYISRNAVEDREFDFGELYDFYRDKEYMADILSKFEYDLKMISKMNPYAAISYIRQVVGYDDYLKEYADYRRMKSQELLEVADEIMEASKEFKTFREWNEHIIEYTAQLKKQANRDDDKKEKICLSTMHSSKGLEYDVVFIIDANEGITPHEKSVLDEDIEEERRMFYVAVTRARHRLHVYSIKERFNKQMEVSRFVGEMLYDIDEFKEGVRVLHKKYGSGIIKKVADNKIIIYFEKLRKELIFDTKFAVSNRIIKKQDEV